VRAAADAMTATADRFAPQPEAQARYDPLYREVYQPLFPAVQPLVDRLAHLCPR
jgi:sugar (pentulose or hexulose) kinase